MKKRVKQIVSVMLIIMMALQVSPISVFTANATETTESKEPICTDAGLMYVYYEDISTYRGTDKSYPEEEGYVFGGWWTGITETDKDANAKSLPEGDDSGSAWAKYVPEDVLTVKAQVSQRVADAIAKSDGDGNTDKLKLRLVTSVDDSEKYREVGFNIKVTKEASCKANFFDTLTVIEQNNADTVEPYQVFKNTASGEFATVVIDGFDTLKKINDTELSVTPYWITRDGTKVYGTARTRLLASDERANDDDGTEDFKVDIDKVNEKNTYQYDNILVNEEETSYKYFVGASDTVYLKAKYTTAGSGNHFGITIRNGGETRQVYFDNLGVKVLAGNSQKDSGLVGLDADHYNTYGADQGVSVWVQRALDYDQYSDYSAIATMLQGTGTEHTVIWAIEQNVLYCSVDDRIVLRMPMEKLCDKWLEGRYYQLGVAAYNTKQIDSQLEIEVKEEELLFGKTAYGEKLLKPEENLSGNKFNITYEPITGSHLVSDINQGAANVSVNTIAGTSGVSADITWAWAQCEWAYAGVYVSYDNVPYEFYAKGHTKGIVRQEDNKKEKDLTKVVKNQGITPFETGSSTSEVTAIIQDGHLYIFYNGQQALDVNLQTLYPSYDKDKSVIELGFACSVMEKGLAYFQDVKSMTEDEIQKMNVTKWKFSAGEFSNVSSVDCVNGKIENNGKLNSTTRVNFMGESDRWEVAGTMYVDSDNTTQMQPQFFITNGETTFEPCLRSQGPRIKYGEYSYTSGTNSNSTNGDLTFNKNMTHTEDFTNIANTGNIREIDEMDFKVVIVNDVMYVWFESAAEEGKLVPAWRLPLATPIYGAGDFADQILFQGFASSDTPLKYKFGLGNTPDCASGGYKNLEVKIGSEVDITCISGHEEFLFKTSNSNYAVELDEETKLPTVTYTGTSKASLELFTSVGANDDVYVETVLKEEIEFVKGSYRLGIQFGGVYFTVSDNASVGLRLQLFKDGDNWQDYISYSLTDEQKQDFKGNGLKIGAARRGGKFYMYIDNNGDMECVIVHEYAQYAQAEFNIKLMTWAEAKGAVYSNLKCEKGSTIYCRDPFIMSYEGKYYLYTRAESSGIECRVSENLITWSDPINVLTPPDDFYGVGDSFWAPECHYYNGNFYIFTAVELKTSGRRVISSYVSDSPLGPFTEPAILYQSNNRDFLDATLYIDENKQPWLVFACDWNTEDDKTGKMYCAKLNDNLSALISTPKLMFNAKEPNWNSHAVTDAPFMYTTANGKLLMLWSGFATKGRGYVVAVSESETGKVDASHSWFSSGWIHHDELLFDKDGGHGMIFKTFEGELMLALFTPNESKTETNRPHLAILELEEKDDMLYLKE